MLSHTNKSDTALYDILQKEYKRAAHNIEMIASESTVPYEVMELSGSIFTNKTLEGYPGNRFQAGSEVADELELLANQRAKDLFGADHVNLQPYSGTSANYSAYAAVLKPGDRVLAMHLDHGGHLTHGSRANFLSKMYDYDHYGVNKDTEEIDYDQLEEKALKNKPALIIAGGSSYPRIIDFARIAEVAKASGALFMVDMAHIAGLVAAQLHPSPVPHADIVTSSTTKTFMGPRAGMILCKEHIAKKIDQGVFPGALGSIHMNTMAAKAWSMKYATSDEFRTIVQRILDNAKALARALEEKGFRIVSGGTDTHIVMVDLRGKNITGKEFQHALDSVGITVNKNQIPFDPASPFITSGARIGTTCVSQRGLEKSEMEIIADIMSQVAENPTDEDTLSSARARVLTLIEAFPLYNDHTFFE